MRNTDIRIRDPYIVADKETKQYFLFGTTDSDPWNGEGEGFKVYRSENLEEWVEEGYAFRPPQNFWANKNFWAPEVYKYNGSYYMFATYYSSLTNHRGCSVLKSSSPEGPFTEITNGHITPHSWDSIDGTFYVDKNGQPWMIFVHEWTCTKDNIGTMAAANAIYFGACRTFQGGFSPMDRQMRNGRLLYV